MSGVHRTVRCTIRQQTSPTAIFCLVAINTTPTGHFRVWESKQHSKSSSWHTQALPTTYIHWSILYTRSSPLQSTQVPQKREWAIESYSIKFSPSALWDPLRDSVCFIFVFHLRVEFWLPFVLPPKCWRFVKASKRHQRVWWSLRDREWSLRRRRARRSLCDRWREGKGWKRPVLKWTPQRGLGLRGPNLGKTNHPCLVCLLLVICLLSLSLSFLALFFAIISLCCLKIHPYLVEQHLARKNFVFLLFLSKPSCFTVHISSSCINYQFRIISKQLSLQART
jgi:hypothetical protein